MELPSMERSSETLGNASAAELLIGRLAARRCTRQASTGSEGEASALPDPSTGSEGEASALLEPAALVALMAAPVRAPPHASHTRALPVFTSVQAAHAQGLLGVLLMKSSSGRLLGGRSSSLRSKSRSRPPPSMRILSMRLSVRATRPSPLKNICSNGSGGVGGGGDGGGGDDGATAARVA